VLNNVNYGVCVTRDLCFTGGGTDHGKEWDGPRGMVVDSYEVDEEGKSTGQGREEGGTNQHLLDPFLSWDASNSVRVEQSRMA